MDRFADDIGNSDTPDHANALKDFGDDWVHELIAMTRPGVEINLPTRGLGDRIIPFQFDDFD